MTTCGEEFFNDDFIGKSKVLSVESHFDEITMEEALQALDNLDNFARMDVGVNAFGPRETLRRFIMQAKADIERKDKTICNLVDVNMAVITSLKDKQ